MTGEDIDDFEEGEGADLMKKIDTKVYGQNHVLGFGRRDSVVVKGIHKGSKKEVAIKIISKKGKTMTEVDKMREVVKMYQLAQHHNVVRLEDYFENRSNLYLCLELHSNITLEEYVTEENEEMTEIRARELI